jgi:phosphatidylserine/phosphatidylglycerophosphate/cardiolipin synthase-like enzyme
MNFAVDTVTGSIFRRRDLTLLWPRDWHARKEGRRSVEIATPDTPIRDLGHVSSLLGALLEEDERLIRVEIGDRPPADRVAMFTVRNGEIEGLPTRNAPALQAILLDAARRAPRKAEVAAAPVQVIVPPIRNGLRPERQTALRQDDFICGGQAHQSHLDVALRRARRHVVIHSTFLRRESFDLLVPALRVAAGHGCRVDILWGQSRTENGFVKSLGEARAIDKRLDELGLAGSVVVHLSSTRSHGKILIADDGAGAVHATVGSCNWLYSGFESFEASVRLRDPHLVGDVINELAELARPPDGQLPELTVRLAQTARELSSKSPLSGNARVRVIIDEEHDDCLLEARDQARRSITVLSHRLGITAKPAVIIPVAAAVRDREEIVANLVYSIPSGPVEQADATAARWQYQEQGVTLEAVQRPRLHAKMLLWDEDEAIVTSLNWLSADATNKTPRGEVGIRITSPRAAEHLREAYKHAQILA